MAVEDAPPGTVPTLPLELRRALEGGPLPRGALLVPLDERHGNFAAALATLLVPVWAWSAYLAFGLERSERGGALALAALLALLVVVASRALWLRLRRPRLGLQGVVFHRQGALIPAAFVSPLGGTAKALRSAELGAWHWLPRENARVETRRSASKRGDGVFYRKTVYLLGADRAGWATELDLGTLRAPGGSSSGTQERLAGAVEEWARSAPPDREDARFGEPVLDLDGEKALLVPTVSEGVAAVRKQEAPAMNGSLRGFRIAFYCVSLLTPIVSFLWLLARSRERQGTAPAALYYFLLVYLVFLILQPVIGRMLRTRAELLVATLGPLLAFAGAQLLSGRREAGSPEVLRLLAEVGTLRIVTVTLGFAAIAFAAPLALGAWRTWRGRDRRFYFARAVAALLLIGPSTLYCVAALSEHWHVSWAREELGWWVLVAWAAALLGETATVVRRMLRGLAI